MVSIKMIPEEEATGRVKEIYEEIKADLGIDFVPNLYRVMAAKPGYLELNWQRSKETTTLMGSDQTKWP